MTSIWDPGLQPERTELAWRRTVLAVTTGTVTSARYLAAEVPVLGVALPVLALVAGLALLVTGTRRLRRLRHHLLAAAGAAEPVMPGAGMLGALAIMCGVVGLAAVAFVITAAGP